MKIFSYANTLVWLAITYLLLHSQLTPELFVSMVGGSLLLTVGQIRITSTKSFWDFLEVNATFRRVKVETFVLVEEEPFEPEPSRKRSADSDDLCPIDQRTNVMNPFYRGDE